VLSCCSSPCHPAILIRVSLEQRAKARVALKELVLSLREIAVAVQEGRFDEATAGLARYREMMTATIGTLERAKQWSLFDRRLHDAHFAAVSQLYQVGTETAK
jgi:uncharacterized protein YfaQ (DUF2300 family)